MPLKPQPTMNQITLPVSELKSALAGFNRVIQRKTTLPVLQTIKLSRTAEGRVSLTGTDLDAFVTYHMEQSLPGETLDVLLPFEPVNKLIKGSSGDLVIIPEAKTSVKLRYDIGRSPLEQSLATNPVAEFPPVPNITELPVKLPAHFGETLRQAFETSSTDSSRYVLQGAYLDVEQPDCHTVVSTNGRALFAANSFTFDLKQPVNIAKHKFLAWPAFLTGESQIAVQPNKDHAGWVQLITPRWTCISRQIDGQFPKWRQVVPEDTDNWTRVQLSEAAMAQMLNLSSKLPGDDTEYRTLRLNVGTEFRLEGANKDDKEYTSAVIPEVKITGKPVLSALNREHLQVALGCGLNEIRVHTELEPLLFSNQGKRMVIIPVRLTGPVTNKLTITKPTPATAPVAVPQVQPERKTPMPETTKPTESKTALDQIESCRTKLRELLTDLNELGSLIKQADRDKRSTEKEVASVRQTIRSLQGLKI